MNVSLLNSYTRYGGVSGMKMNRTFGGYTQQLHQVGIKQAAMGDDGHAPYGLGGENGVKGSGGADHELGIAFATGRTLKPPTAACPQTRIAFIGFVAGQARPLA